MGLISAENRITDGVGPAEHTRHLGFAGWYTVVILTSCYILSFADRQLLSMVIGPLKHDMEISDFQVSLLLGLSFAILYAFGSAPAGYLTDRMRRKPLAGMAVLFWSAMEIACGLTRSFGQLFIGRMGLGIGEAGLNPAAYSLMRDAFPPHRRGIAFSIFALGPFLGIGVALMTAALLLRSAERGAFVGMPFLGTLKPWQVVLIVPGLVGIPLGMMCFGIQEPRRPDDVRDYVSFGKALAFARDRWTLYLPICLAFTLFSVGASGLGAWVPEATSRAWGVPVPEVGKIAGPITIIGSAAGLLIMGSIMDWLTRRGWSNAVPAVGACSTTCSAMALIPALFIESRTVSVVLFGLQTLLFAVFNPACMATLAQITPTRLMGKISSLNLMVATLLGLSSGPTIVVMMSGLFEGSTAIGRGMVVTFATCFLISAGLLAYVARQLRR